MSAPAKRWWICRCGRPFDRHPRRTFDGGYRVYVCALLPSGRFESETLPGVYFDPLGGGLVTLEPSLA